MYHNLNKILTNEGSEKEIQLYCFKIFFNAKRNSVAKPQKFE